jgi:hypothetical protein
MLLHMDASSGIGAVLLFLGDFSMPAGAVMPVHTADMHC